MAFEDSQHRAEFVINPGGSAVFNLPAGLNITRGNVEIEATVVVSGGTSSGTAITEGGPIGLIRRIRVLANRAAGSRYPQPPRGLVNCSPQTLVRYAMTQRQGKFVGELSGSTLGNGAAGTYNIFLSIPIYFADDTNVNAVQTALNMNVRDSTGAPVYTAVQVQVEFAQLLNEMFNGNDRTMVITGFCRWSDERIALQTDTVPLVQEDHDLLIMAAQNQLVDSAMPADGAFQSWLILAQQGGPTFPLSDAILNRLTIQGSSLAFKHNWQEIRQSMIDTGMYDPSATMTGQFFLDWTLGVLANSNAAAGLQHQLSVENPSGAGLDRLRIYTRRVFGLAAAA